jgi:hypothetical protein
MAYETREQKACAEIEAAQEAVEAAQRECRRGGGPGKVTKADKALADAHERYREITGGNVRDSRS